MILEHTWKALQTFQNATQEAEEVETALKLTVDEQGSTVARLLMHSMLAHFKGLSHDPLDDCVRLRATDYSHECQVAIDAFRDASMDHHKGPDYAKSWKAKLNDGSSQEQIMIVAAATLGTLKGGAVKTKIDELSKVTATARKFMETFKSFGREIETLGEVAISAKKELDLGTIMTIEALLHHALSTRTKATGQNIVRSQLAEMTTRGITEDKILPGLLKAAKELIGS
eukprot:s10909_g1.t1